MLKYLSAAAGAYHGIGIFRGRHENFREEDGT